MSYVLQDYDAAHNEETLMMLITEVSRATAFQVLNQLNLTEKWISFTKAYKTYGRKNVETWISRKLLEIQYTPTNQQRLLVQDLENLAGVNRIYGYQNFIVVNFVNLYIEYSKKAKWKMSDEQLTEEFRSFLDWKMNWYEMEKREEWITKAAKDANYLRYKNMFLRYKQTYDSY